MLKGIHPILHPDLLHVLASMGHGDSIAIVDSNFPAASTAQGLVIDSPLVMGVDVILAVKAILTVLPIDTFTPEEPPVLAMQIVGQPAEIPEVVQLAAPVFKAEGADVALIERFAFYAAAKDAFAVVKTTETRLYGNFIIRKGVVRSDL
ncbi:RbsD/FucU family protein [Pseudorhodobacter sp.]|uniref:RbsD/FucU family protein n=1 Tax=Pseudorhodobacter sp. TaxID=1934400 RepID=UPI0026494304|nr:RbsD/FucU domain-containing protein [Pseudorhodobacter sp.]MDN5786177.1 ribose ABC transporter [Pseudorhodobacter sp.]